MRARITPILPKKPFADIRIYEEAIEEALDQTADESLKDYEKTVATWENKPNFHVRKTQYGRSVGTAHHVFGYVDLGTRPHFITPKRPGYPLRFNIGGRPKTRVFVIGSSAGSRGTTPVAAYRVTHPGTQARQFTQTINVRNQQRFPKNLRAALKRAMGK